MKKLLIGISIILLSGCATYSETTESQQLASDVYRISMRGNAFSEDTDSGDFALLKAAEVTLDNGDRYFVVTNAEDKTRHTSYTSQGTSTSNTYGTVTSNTNASIYGNQVLRQY